MCGIAGTISSDLNNVSTLRLQQMTNALRHRGPEGEGFWISENGRVGFGHRRLSIIDLTPAGEQPMHYLNRYTITYNGEIYNYIELKTDLEKKGYTFTSHSDTEVILAAYACYDNQCLQHFDGMFAFAIWDDKTQTLFCARDRFGEKPFYYTNNASAFLFASEMKALWAVGIEKKVQPSLLASYLALGLTTNPLDACQTFYKNIYNLPAGHYLQLQLNPPTGNGQSLITVQSYWDLDCESLVVVSPNEAAEQFMHLLQTSVQRRLRSHVPIGTSLSGGLDSSSVVALINQNLHQAGQYRHASFSAVFPGFKKNESSFIQQVANTFNLKNYTVTPGVDDLIGDLEKLAYHQEEPFQSSSIYAQYKVYQLAKQHNVTVLLDGQGADETLAGYQKYYHWYWQELLAAGECKLCRSEIKLARQNGITTSWNYKNYLAAFMPTLATRQLQRQATRQVKQNQFLNPGFFKPDEPNPVYKPVITHLNQLLYFNTRQAGLPELLQYADRNAMAHSREVRLPFLSHQLVEFIFSLPSALKIKDGYTKWILRHSIKDQLPPNIVWRKDKVGFEPPQQQWMQDKRMQDYLHESRRWLVSKGILKAAILNHPLQPQHAHAANNFDWRYLCAYLCFQK